jgi:predicted Co/Zn/Cd cation transporter (cation efflux family)
MSRSEALKELGDRVQRTKTTISLFGISIDEKLAAIAAPASLFLIILYLYVHVLLAEYPWAPLFVGLKGTVSTSVMLLGLPVIALAVFCVRVWRSGLLSSGGSSIPGWEALVIAAATIAVCGALTLALNKLRRLSSSNPAVTERAATAPAAES